MRLVISIMMITLASLRVFGEENIKITRVHSNLEAYQFSDTEQAIHSVTNARLSIGRRDFVNLEVIGGVYNREGATIWTPGDCSITYSHAFTGKGKGKSGWQGWSPMVKLIFPTGDPENAAIFGHWLLEPAFQYSWNIFNDNFFVQNRWRVIFPLVRNERWPEPPIFLRFEPQFGYRSNGFTASATMDNRMVFNQDAYVIFARIDAGYDFSKRSGVYSFYTRRVRETALFRTYAGVGLYRKF